MTFLAAKKTYRYGDSIAYPQVSRVPRLRLACRSVRFAHYYLCITRYSCLTLLRETTVV